MRPRTSRYLRPSRRRISLALATILTAGLLQATAPGTTLPAVAAQAVDPTDRPVQGSYGSPAEPRAVTKGPRVPKEAPRHTWPKDADTIVTLRPADGSKKMTATAGPLSLAAPSKTTESTPAQRATNAATPSDTRIRTQILDRYHTRQANIDGLLFTLEPADPAPARKTAQNIAVTLDYRDFAGAYGGSYAARLQLVELPACVLATPQKNTCHISKPVRSGNDPAKQTLTAQSVALHQSGPTVLAAVAAASSDKGNYQATSLSDSGSWSTDLNTGDFSWAYSMTPPSVPGGLAPALGLSYSSGSVDGRTATTNNQGSWAGDGFELAPGSIERRYKPCADDGVKNPDGSKPGDQCWAYDNAFLSFNGKGGELVPTGKDEFKLKRDDGTLIKRLRSTDRDNGDDDNEYWELTDTGGTRYYFGYNKLPGWASGKKTTDSTWTVPVFGNNADEPCHKSAFASSWCQQAWRWNLDYVVDTHGNAMSYQYVKEANSYGRNLKKDDDTPYTRGGYLDHIEYGLKSDKMYTDKAQATVTFDNAERCLPQSGVTCDPAAIDTKASYWYDTPWDMNCKPGTACDQGRMAPTFWTRKRLTGITTRVLQPDGTYADADTWSFTHRWEKADTDYQLLLESIQHTGRSDTPVITLPKTTFAYAQLANRLDKTGDGYAPFIKARLKNIDGDSGSQTDINYSEPACDWNALPKPETNTTRCFPQYIGGDSEDDPELQWFNKYVTTDITVSDRTGGAPDQITHYDYLGPAAWHYTDDDGLTKEKFRTWSQWRGYGQVSTQTGDISSMKTRQDSYFLRGMDDDRKDKSGGTKSVSVTLASGEGDALTDHAAFASFGYKTVTYDKPGGKTLAKSVTRPWHHETAKKVRDWGTVTADLTGASETRSWTSLDDGAGTKWRTTTSETKQDTVAGRVTEVNDLGDDSTPNDDQCTRTTYATNTSANILGAADRVETVAKACTATPDRTKDVISDTRTAYDGATYGTAPTKGDVTATATLKSYSGTRATYLESGTTVDSYGRPLTATDLTATVTVDGSAAPVRTKRTDGRIATTVYTPTTGQPTQIKTTTPPSKAGDSTTSLTSTQTLDTVRGQVLKETDPNGNVTESKYDALGRSTKIWLPNRRNTLPPSYQFTYTIADGQPTAVATQTLDNNGGQTTASYTLYDGLLRQRQTQTPGPEGGTIVSDAFHDARGLNTKSFAPYFTPGKPSTKLFLPDNSLSVDSQTHTDYDGLGRPVETRLVAGSGSGEGEQTIATTKTIYGGDRTTVIPPTGGTATTTVTDARGRTTQLLQLHQRTIGAAADTTRYAYNTRGGLEKVTDPAGNSWTYTYDQMGRQTKTTDPDKGTSETFYDDRGQVEHTKDSRGALLYHLYDNRGRPNELRQDSPTGTLRSKWTYDTATKGKGLPAESIRYDNGHPYTSKVTDYDNLGRAYKTAVVIPENEKGLAGTYQSGITYKPSGLTAGTSTTAVGSLPPTTTNYSYDDETMWPTGVATDGMTGKTTYFHTGLPATQTLGPTGSSQITEIKNEYERGTQRLASSVVSRMNQPGIDRSAQYHYDEAGNITSVADTSRTGTDNQCYIYDYLGRLTEAWTQATTTCTATPATIGGPAPYWHTYGYDLTGNRTTETQHDPTRQSTKDTRRTYTYPPAGNPQPHTLTAASTTGPAGTTTDNYTYDQAGNTKSRPGQTLTWDPEGHLASATQDSKVTQYLYDNDGNRLIARTPTETTLYLGGTELTLTEGASKPKATRYTDLGNGVTAIQNDDRTFSYTLPDHQGTGQLAINATTLAIQQRRTTPFGSPRGTEPASWPGTKGFLGGTDDSETTGLQHLGAREYDPSTGRFISVDPLMDLSNPQSINGYAYANNSPVSNADPDGLRLAGCTGGWNECGPDAPKKGTHRGAVDTDALPQANPKEIYTPSFDDYTNVTAPIDDSLYLNGIRIPPEKELSQRFVTAKSYPEMVMQWAGEQCSTGTNAACLGAHDLGWIEGATKEEALEVTGAQDAINCAKGSAAGCAWTVVNFAPVGKMAKIAKIAKLAFKSGRAAKSAERIARTLRAASCPGNSFTSDTLVLLADGSTKSISDVKVGDLVEATDPRTGKSEAKKVTAEIIGEGIKHLVRIEVKAGVKGHERISVTATDGHPFWVPALGKWVDATDLTAGESLRTSSGHEARIISIERWSEWASVRNLTVDELHTYYVLAGAAPVLVHNSNGACGAASIPNLHGKSLDEAEMQIFGQGFKFKSETGGGYRRYDHSDGSVLWIRPNGEVQRIGPKIDPGPNQKNYSQRYGPDGQVTTEHSTGEVVAR